MLLLEHLFLLFLVQAPVFEVASVKPSIARGWPTVRADAGQITFTNVTLVNVLMRAYDVKSYQIRGPAWLSSERYDIVAKIPADSSKEQVNLMIQHLVAERFHLALHHETREFQGYELVVVKSGSKLKASTEKGSDAESEAPPKTDADGFPRLDAPGLAMMEGMKGRAVVSFLTARAQPVSALVDQLSKEFRMPVLDKTGLTGRFDFKLEFAPQPPGAMTVEANDDAGANLLTAVQQQLGLKLMPAKVPLDVLVVDRADKSPAEN